MFADKDCCQVASDSGDGVATKPGGSEVDSDAMEKGEEVEKEAGEAQSPQLPMSSSLDISEQVGVSMKLVGPFLCELLVEHKAVLSKVLVGADGRQLLSDSESSVLSVPCPWCGCGYGKGVPYELCLLSSHVVLSLYPCFCFHSMTAAVMKLAESRSTLEITMLLCSQVRTCLKPYSYGVGVIPTLKTF